MDTTKKLNTISFFTGYGGVERGLEMAGERINHLAVCEIEAYAIANLVAKMEEGALDSCPIWTDAKTFPAQSFRGKVDLFTGGFPCQPFSAAGGRKADEDPRHLFPACLRFIEEAQPKRVFLENVEGLISAKLGGDDWADPQGTPVLLHVLRELERRGYATAWGVFSASEAGAPHQRKRVFILAHAKHLRQLPSKHPTRSREGLPSDGSPTDKRDEILAHAHDVGLEHRGDFRGFREASETSRSQGGEPTQAPQDDSITRCGAEELAHANSGGSGGRGSLHRHQTHREGIQSNTTGDEDRIRSEMSGCSALVREELAHAQNLLGDHGKDNEGEFSKFGSIPEFRNSSGEGDLWPSRPGQQQHEWEAPRVVAKSNSKGSHGSKRDGANSEGRQEPIGQLSEESLCRGGADAGAGSSSRSTEAGLPSKPGLGGAVDGATHRVDRLRLLGNGVVPNTAAIAWEILNKEVQCSLS